MTSPLGNKLRKLRKDKGMTLEELSNQAGLSKSYLWELENRESRSPSLDKLRALANELGVTVAFLIDEDSLDPDEKQEDEAFFRGYQKLDLTAKEQLKKIMETFKNKP